MSTPVSKSNQIRGSHHCIGASRMTVDTIFGIIHSRAVAYGGLISAQAIMDAKAQFIESLPSGIDLFEKTNRECMTASKSSAPDPFSRDMILTTLLAACGKGSAEHTFRLQIDQCGQTWLNYFFHAFAQCAKNNLSQASRGRLISAFVGAAAKTKANMQVSDLINRSDVKEILLECIAPFSKTLELDEIAKSIGFEVNNYIANQYNIAGPFIAKISDDQIKRFLEMFSNEMPLIFHPLVTGDKINLAS
jgi:hypothetical protein